jgi:hypothetical protein
VKALDALQRVDRRWIYLFVGLSCVVPFIFPLGLPVGKSDAVQALFDRVESLEPGEIAMLSFDYGPSTGPENDPMAQMFMRHLLAKGHKLVAIALWPIGGLTEGNEEFLRATGGWDPETLEFVNFPGKYYGTDAVYLGYKDGALAAMRQMNEQLHAVFPQDYYLRAPTDSLPLTQEVRGYGDLAFCFSVSTGIIGEYWANLVNAQYGLPVASGCTAVSAPKYFAYLRAGQMFALLGGLKGAAEYEELVMEAYPHIRELTEAEVYYAAKGWDVQSLVYSIIIVFIILGNIAYLAERRRERARGA